MELPIKKSLCPIYLCSVDCGADSNGWHCPTKMILLDFRWYFFGVLYCLNLVLLVQVLFGYVNQLIKDILIEAS